MIGDQQPGIVYNKRYMLVLVLACVLRVEIFLLKVLREISLLAIGICSWIVWFGCYIWISTGMDVIVSYVYGIPTDTASMTATVKDNQHTTTHYRTTSA